MYRNEEIIMEKKVLLVLFDGLRPEGVEGCSNPFLRELKKKATYTMTGSSVFPSITLPCHMSIFYSMIPETHGVKSNLYIKPTIPAVSLWDLLAQNGKKNFFFYNWEELRDVAKPGSMARLTCISHELYWEKSDLELAELTIDALKGEQPDFMFWYVGHTDETAHKYGWLTPEYFESIDLATGCLERIFEVLPENYSVILTADHGGNGNDHGSDMPEDMIIPMFFYGPDFEAGKEITGTGLIDIAPTVATLLGCEIPEVWEGKSLV